MVEISKYIDDCCDSIKEIDNSVSAQFMHNVFAKTGIFHLYIYLLRYK